MTEILESEKSYSPMTKKVARSIPTAMPTGGIPGMRAAGWKHLFSTHLQKVTEKQNKKVLESCRSYTEQSDQIIVCHMTTALIHLQTNFVCDQDN